MTKAGQATPARPVLADWVRDEMMRVVASLMFLLEGMETERDVQRFAAHLRRVPAPVDGQSHPLPQDFDVPLPLEGDQAALDELLRRAGAVEQLAYHAYHGWLQAVCRGVEAHLAEADACGQGRADLPAALLDINWRERDVGHPLDRPRVRV